MASTTTLRWRRSAAQLHALEEVEREIRATDPHLRRKYLRDFQTAYQTYEAVLTPAQLQAECLGADIILAGDYHALAASQRFAGNLVRHLKASNRKVVLGLEFVFARDQHILNEWLAGDIDEQELRDRIRFDLDWGYEWQPFRELLESGREFADAVYGLDCLPRNNLRKIAWRDQHAAAKIAEIRERHPDAVVVVLFGESHLAPTHLPLCLQSGRPYDRILTVLQNIDALYWRAAGEPMERVEAVRVNKDVVCVFNSSPLEKYESYRLCIDRWRQERTTVPDLTPTVYNMVAALVRFLNIDQYSPTTGTQPRFLVDQLPEVCRRFSDDRIRRLMLRRGAHEDEVRGVLTRVEDKGTCYVPRLNALLVRDFNLAYGAEDAARFIHHASRDTADRRSKARPNKRSLGEEDRFYGRVLEEALGYFGSRALYPARPPVREVDIYSLYSQSREDIDGLGFCSFREYMQMLDFLVLHKDYEANCRHYRERPQLLYEGVRWKGEQEAFVTGWLGQMLGSQIYEAYISGKLSKRSLRSLFLRKLDDPGAARTTYFVTVRRLRKSRRQRR